jgi:valyl-tRNA synthetase
MVKLNKKYNPLESEKKWQEYWENNGIFKFDWNDTDRNNVFSIDTPPPTVSGTLHMGHIFSFTHCDLIARFQRMYGKNVFYPVGFDDNGLPTERYVEKKMGIKGKEMPRDKFIEICRKEIKQAEDVDFFNLFHSISHSYDWSLKYQSISEKSKHVSQLSFIDLYNKGVLYRKDEPCIWDVIDQTALAQSEVEDKEIESKKNYLKFDIIDSISFEQEINFYQMQQINVLDSIEIMTTRPELLSSCVGLICHPSLYAKYENKMAVTPLGVIVPIIPDEKADLEKGTGFVMCCTFGDQTDIEWWKKYNLKLRISINETGQIKFDELLKKIINTKYYSLEGLKLNDAREKILELLADDNKITRDPEKITHFVKVGERSKFPIEFLIKKQWNIKLLGDYNQENIKQQLHIKVNEIIWHPDWMKSRMHNWIDGLNWDWTVSRQRFSGIHLPVWYSKRNYEYGKVILATPDQLPVDPLVDLPKGYTRDEVIGDPDVLDTWATSAISPQLNSWGITNELYVDNDRFNKLPIPFDLRNSAHEIIRTWHFSALVKAFYHQNTIPFKNLMISGWCLATDKTKMSKSKGNIIDPIKLIETNGSDALRYWASNATLGMDTAYSEDQIGVGQKLITKIYNSAKFVEICLEKIENISKIDAQIINITDKWIINETIDVIERATNYFKDYEFSKALNVIEKFFWNFCDNYLEIIKVRCYGVDGLKYKDKQLNETQIIAINSEQESAIKTIYLVFNSILKLFAPFIPAVCDEIYSSLYEDEFKKTKSISSRGNWAKTNNFKIDILNKDEHKKNNDLILNILFEVRKYKSEKNISIKETIDNIEVYTTFQPEDDIIEDLKNVCSINNIKFVVNDKNKDFKINI